jgi:hypothetical protein
MLTGLQVANIVLASFALLYESNAQIGLFRRIGGVGVKKRRTYHLGSVFFELAA